MVVAAVKVAQDNLVGVPTYYELVEMSGFNAVNVAELGFRAVTRTDENTLTKTVGSGQELIKKGVTFADTLKQVKKI